MASSGEIVGIWIAIGMRGNTVCADRDGEPWWI